MARTTVQPIVNTEDAALRTREAAATGARYAKAGAILGYCFLRTLITGKVTEQPQTPARRQRRK